MTSHRSPSATYWNGADADSNPVFLYLPFDRLTGLLSFMLSDEMTTGSVTTSDAEKRTYAASSHSWNLQQRRFKEAFPDVSTATVRAPPIISRSRVHWPP